MTLFRPLFCDAKTSFYSVALALVIATLFLARAFTEVPVNSYALALLIIAWIFEGRWREKLIGVKSPLVFLPAVLFMLYLIGVLYSNDQSLAWKSLEQKLMLILGPVLIAGSASFKKEHLGWTLFIFVFSAAATMVVAFGLALSKGLSGKYGDIGLLDMITYEKLASTVAFQPIYLSFYVVFAFFALWFLYSNSRFSGQIFFRNRRLVYPLMFFFFAAVVMLSSRMEIMVLFATFAVMIFVHVRQSAASRRKYLVVYTAMLILAVAMIIGSKENKQRFTEMVDVEADYTQNKYGGRSIRFHKWLNTIECWSDHWLIGTGTGDMQHKLNETYRKNEFSLALQYSFNPHNQYLETLLTLGLPGFSVLVGWMLALLLVAWRNRNAVMLAFGLIVSMSMITESMLERHWGLVFIALFSAVLLTDNFKYFSGQSATAE